MADEVNTPESIDAFQKIIKEGGHLLCHPSQYGTILSLARERGVGEEVVVRLRPSPMVQRGVILAVNKIWHDRKQAYIFRS